MDRIATEQHFHELQAKQRAADGVALQFADSDYLDHEIWIRPAFAQLGDVRGLRVLDCGCGHGMAAVVLARAGARVTALDLSAGYLAEARARAQANGVAVDCVQANAEYLPLADSSFDLIWGCAILHHLDIVRAGADLRRVLRRGGRAVFCEPWNGNPLVNFARRSLPYPGKHRTPDETPLARADLRRLRANFPRVHLRGYQLLSMACRVVPAPQLRRPLERCDGVLLECVPALQHFCRYIVLTLQTAR